MENKNKVFKYWLDGSKNSLELAGFIYKKGYYDHALFCAHLSVEKLLKAKIVEKTNNFAPHSHDLLYLAGLAGIDIDEKQQQFLVEVNAFNIEGRYPEERLEFSRKISKVMAEKYIKKIGEFYKWLLQQKEKN